MDQPKKSMDNENSSLSSIVSHTYLRMDEFDHATSMSHQLTSSKTKSGPREHSLTVVAHRKSSIQPKRSLPEEIMKRNFKTFSPSNVVVKIPTESKIKRLCGPDAFETVNDKSDTVLTLGEALDNFEQHADPVV